MLQDRYCSRQLWRWHTVRCATWGSPCSSPCPFQQSGIGTSHDIWNGQGVPWEIWLHFLPGEEREKLHRFLVACATCRQCRPICKIAGSVDEVRPWRRWLHVCSLFWNIYIHFDTFWSYIFSLMSYMVLPCFTINCSIYLKITLYITLYYYILLYESLWYVMVLLLWLAFTVCFTLIHKMSQNHTKPIKSWSAFWASIGTVGSLDFSSLPSIILHPRFSKCRMTNLKFLAGFFTLQRSSSCHLVWMRWHYPAAMETMRKALRVK